MGLYTLALELVALFGFLCLLLNVLLPVLGFVLRFVLVDAPHEWKKWQLHRSQQRELRRLQRRVDTLNRRKLADEQETRRRARAASAKKRQHAEETPQHALDGRLHPIAGLVSNEGAEEWRTQTPRQQRHRLGINSTAKKLATGSNTRERRRMRWGLLS